MTNKILLGCSISVLAMGFMTMPAVAADKAKYKTVSKSGKIECEVTVTDGEVTIQKTVNGKKVKVGPNDKDCNTEVKFLGKMDGAFDVNVEKMKNGKKIVKVMVMGDDDAAFPMGESMRVIANDDGDENVRVFMRKGMGHGGNGHAMNWFSKEGSGFGDMGFGPGMNWMGKDGLHMMMLGGDNEELDLNKDGKVTETEARTARNNKLKSYDSNRDGRLSLNEFQALWLADRHARMVDAFQNLDEDGDAQVTSDEFSDTAVSRAKRHARMMKMMEEHKAKAEKQGAKKSKRK